METELLTRLDECPLDEERFRALTRLDRISAMSRFLWPNRSSNAPLFEVANTIAFCSTLPMLRGDVQQCLSAIHPLIPQDVYHTLEELIVVAHVDQNRFIRDDAPATMDEWEAWVETF